MNSRKKVEIRRIGEPLLWELELDQVHQILSMNWRNKIESNSEINELTGIIEKIIQWIIERKEGERKEGEKKEKGWWEIIIKETEK